MFTELYQLIQKANLKNISLTLQDEGNGKNGCHRNDPK